MFELTELSPPPQRGGGGCSVAKAGGGAARPRRQTNQSTRQYHLLDYAHARHPLRPLRGHLPRYAVEEILGRSRSCS